MKPLSPMVCIEHLESRELFAGITFAHHKLSLVGNANYSNTMTVGLTPDGLSVSAEVIYQTAKRKVDYSKIIPLADGISVVIMQGGNNHDYIAVDQTYGSFPIPCGINGGTGSDTLIGGDSPDFIRGGKGDDLIYGAGGNDTLLGQEGDDTLYGGAGDDFLNGATGHDMLFGGDGNDILSDAQGPDTVIGGAGDNIFYIHSFKTDRDNDYDKTKDKVHFVTADGPTPTSTSFLDTVFPIFSVL